MRLSRSVPSLGNDFAKVHIIFILNKFFFRRLGLSLIYDVIYDGFVGIFVYQNFVGGCLTMKMLLYWGCGVVLYWLYSGCTLTVHWLYTGCTPGGIGSVLA